MDLGESKGKGVASGRSDFSGLYNTSPWEQRRREGEGARKMRAKFDEFQRWFQQNGASLIEQWQALDEAELAAAGNSAGGDRRGGSQKRGDQKWSDVLGDVEQFKEKEGGKSWAFYDELCDHFGPALTTNTYTK